ncbi:hypothetical protein LUW75_16230 [Streptomyces sp. MRC013]|uniref:hypothetical protein n=1 Tax=Streptomyces sp. MRC013 TaxID=2898276 RepID=UPI002026A203|nr:hypothetical protein [Streptomyces sp. MRC013]URM91272.1 hypothetical protein LUW75_16230 [Streptomyces sp. MRC013]
MRPGVIALRAAAVAAVLALAPAAGPALADDPPGAGRDRPAAPPAPAEPYAPDGEAADAVAPGGDGAVAPGGDGAVANAPSVAGHGPGTRHTVTGLALAGVAAVAVAVRSAHRGRRPDADPGVDAD